MSFEIVDIEPHSGKDEATPEYRRIKEERQAKMGKK